MKVIYLDNNATTRMAPEVLKAMLPFLKGNFGNPSSLHSLGNQAHQEMEKARAQVARFIGARPKEIVFTSGGTESNNLAILGLLEARPSKRHLITTRGEHPSVRSLIEWLEKKKGYKVTWLTLDCEGLIDTGELERSIRPDTALISLMWANNETGVLSPVEHIARIAKTRGIAYHCDAVQAVGRVPIDVSRVPVDLLSISGHKLHAPKGVAALYVRRGTRIKSHQVGGHQEGGRRPGTENVASIIGFGKACTLAHEALDAGVTERIRVLRDRLEGEILKRIPDARVNGHTKLRVANTLCVSFGRVEGESVLLCLSEHGLCASSGSACTTGSLEPSPVLLAMGMDPDWALGAVRFSLSRYTTPAEIDEAIELLPGVLERLRALSPREREETLERALSWSA